MTDKVLEMQTAMVGVLATAEVESMTDVMELLAESTCRLLCSIAQEVQGLKKEDFHDLIKCYGEGIMKCQIEF